MRRTDEGPSTTATTSITVVRYELGRSAEWIGRVPYKKAAKYGQGRRYAERKPLRNEQSSGLESEPAASSDTMRSTAMTPTSPVRTSAIG
ncbi:hypothetical protein LA76x_2628 [Lysobacter antibioticus]|uniref:Uncharacterized protein n=1 Tax=Lysobacter antibioticus TaxID=84531 RepID=A0A0S2FB90_LYSAN|nr:hypothetical protein LA76x_2628 [Lysobacter antibioticus]